MEVRFHRNFYKLYNKLPAKIRTRFEERLVTFQIDPFDQTLRNHPLAGRWLGLRSINVTGDYRAIYGVVDDDVALFVVIGTHSELYG